MPNHVFFWDALDPYVPKLSSHLVFGSMVGYIECFFLRDTHPQCLPLPLYIYIHIVSRLHT